MKFILSFLFFAFLSVSVYSQDEWTFGNRSQCVAQVQVLYTNGTGTSFTSTPNSQWPGLVPLGYAIEVVKADFDGDGNPDIEFYQDNIQVFANGPVDCNGSQIIADGIIEHTQNQPTVFSCTIY